MKILRPAMRPLAGSIWLRDEIVSTPGMRCCERERTIVVRFGSGLPIASNVLRPMTITCPVVISLNHLKSSGRCQGVREPAPITRLRDIAAMALNGFTRESVRRIGGEINSMKLIFFWIQVFQLAKVIHVGLHFRTRPGSGTSVQEYQFIGQRQHIRRTRVAPLPGIRGEPREIGADLAGLLGFENRMRSTAAH